MRKVYSLFLLFILQSSANAQLPDFDTSYVIASSTVYDYTNPVYIGNRAISPFFPMDWVVYEKSSGNTSNIILRRFRYSGYDPEISITNDTGVLNINPSISGNPYTGYVLFWQSNKNGNWDIYYSKFDTSGSYTVPAPMDLDPGDELNPFITQTNGNRFLLTFEFNGDIKVSRFLYSTETFYGDTNLTTHIGENCSRPLITGGFDIGVVSYEINYGAVKDLRSKRFWVNSDTSIIWQSEWMNPQQSSQNRFVSIFANGNFLSYDYDTLGSKHVIYNRPDFTERYVLTKNFDGKCYNGRSSFYPIITDNSGSEPYYDAFAFLNKRNDSTFVTAFRSDINPTIKRFYIGDSTVQSNMNMSPVIFQQNFYKIRVVWEQVINGRTALVESYMTDFINTINQVSNNVTNFYTLHQNYPNPFNPVTRIKFSIPKKGDVSLKVYDVMGREIAELVKGELQAGVYEYEFDGTGLGSGVYFYKLQSGEFTETRRMVLVK